MSTLIHREETTTIENHGHCLDCEGLVQFNTREEVDAHISETIAASAEKRSHTISCRPGSPLDPRKAHASDKNEKGAIRRAKAIIAEAIEEVVDDILGMVESEELTTDEARVLLQNEFLEEYESRL